MTRNAGKRGLLPQRDNSEGRQRFAIKWAHEYLDTAITVAYPLDVSEGITAWGMLGNDTYGDCGPAAVAHERMLAGAHPTTAEIEKLYLTYTAGQDVGVVLADFLLWLFQGGYIEGFAPVAKGTEDRIMAEFRRGVLLGVSLTGDANDLFNQGLPWTTANGELPDPSEGHAILKVGSAGASDAGTIVTWGADQLCTGPWLHACTDEAWVMVTKDDMGDGAYAALLADLEALPHSHVVTPPPAPTPVPPTPPPAPFPAPTPTPTPGPSPADVHGLLKTFAADVRAALRALERGIEHLFGK